MGFIVDEIDYFIYEIAAGRGQPGYRWDQAVHRIVRPLCRCLFTMRQAICNFVRQQYHL
jgi:hypothetical protein